jgi:hypothetical protein
VEAAWFGIGLLIGIPFGWLLLLVGGVRWLIHAAELGDSAPEPAPGTAADRKVKGDS